MCGSGNRWHCRWNSGPGPKSSPAGERHLWGPAQNNNHWGKMFTFTWFLHFWCKGRRLLFFSFFFANARSMLKASHAWEEGIFRAAPLVRVSLFALAPCLPPACLAFAAPPLAWKRRRKCRLSCRLIEEFPLSPDSQFTFSEELQT